LDSPGKTAKKENTTAPGTRKKALKKKRPAGGKAKKTKRREIGPKKVKALAVKYQNLADADAAADLNVSLVDYIKKYKDLAAAWDRGRLVRNIRELAGTPITITQAEITLELKHGELFQMIQDDPEIRDLWNAERLALIITVQKAILEKAKAGQNSAIKQIEHLLKNEIAGRDQVDFTHVSINELGKLTGRTRQAVHEWHIKHGLNRNSDKTFNLFEFIPWYHDFILTKKADAPGRTSSNKLDPLRDARARKLQVEMEKEQGQLLDREQVIAGLLARQQVFISSIENKSETLAGLCINKPQKKIQEILENFFDDTRRRQCMIPEVLQLPPEAQTLFSELINILSGGRNE